MLAAAAASWVKNESCSCWKKKRAEANKSILHIKNNWRIYFKISVKFVGVVEVNLSWVERLWVQGEQSKPYELVDPVKIVREAFVAFEDQVS